MERLAVGSAVIGLMFLISRPSAFAAGQQGFSIKVFTSPDDQFWANSVIIEGAREVMLADAQLTKTSAEKVLQQIEENTAAADRLEKRASRRIHKEFSIGNKDKPIQVDAEEADHGADEAEIE